MKYKEIILNEERNVKLTVCSRTEHEGTDQKKRPAVLIIPGGGYSYCSDHEAEVVATPYLEAGYQAFVLRYSVGEHKTWPNPLDDYEQAMELIIKNAEKWKINTDKIAVIGFSAGGHLAASAATMGKHRPNAAILGYAALNREMANICQPGMPSPIDFVDEHTCPCFLFSARDDLMTPIENTLEFQDALVNYGIMFESHIYAYGGHGFSTGENVSKLCSRAPEWVQDSIGWLQDMFGTMQEDGFSKPVCPAKMNGDWEEVLSVDCSIGHMRKQSNQVQQLVKEALAEADKLVENRGWPGIDLDMTIIVTRIKVRELLLASGKSEHAIEQLDAELKKIPNQ